MDLLAGGVVEDALASVDDDGDVGPQLGGYGGYRPAGGGQGTQQHERTQYRQEPAQGKLFYFRHPHELRPPYY